MKENLYESEYYKRTKDEKRWNSFPGNEIVRYITDRSVEKLLDLGCGTGEILAALPVSMDYTGIDASKFAAAEGIRKWTSRPLTKFLHTPSTPVPFADESFDAVLLFYSLEHIRNPKEILYECRRILKKQGILIIVAPNLEFPLAHPNALRHKSSWYRIWFAMLRAWDYVKRLCGILSFRVLEENFTEATGRYEKKDDDLTHVVSSFEVVRFLERNNFFLEKFFDPGVHSWRRIIRMFPCMRWYGIPLAAVFVKK